MNEELIKSLTERALAGDIKAARLVLAQPRCLNVKIANGECTARGGYLGVWESLASGQITIAEAKDLLDIFHGWELRLTG
jgi:hypothetical protein